MTNFEDFAIEVCSLVPGVAVPPEVWFQGLKYYLSLNETLFLRFDGIV